MTHNTWYNIWFISIVVSIQFTNIVFACEKSITIRIVNIPLIQNTIRCFVLWIQSTHLTILLSNVARLKFKAFIKDIVVYLQFCHNHKQSLLTNYKIRANLAKRKKKYQKKCTERNWLSVYDQLQSRLNIDDDKL